jgi:uncharacterized protein
MKGHRFRNCLLAALGIFFVVLAAVGIFVPLLPTTPFLLLAAACFIRSSKRLYDWMMNNRVFGPYIKNYRERKAVPRRIKAVSLVLLWAAIGISIFRVAKQSWIQIALLLIAIGVTWHILSLNTLLPINRERPEPPKEDKAGKRNQHEENGGR